MVFKGITAGNKSIFGLLILERRILLCNTKLEQLNLMDLNQSYKAMSIFDKSINGLLLHK